MSESSDRDLRVDPAFFQLLARSYRERVAAPLVPEGCEAQWLYNDAPFAVLAHNTDPDPRFVYANRTAQSCFEYTWEEFIRIPSRLSAEPLARAERDRLLAQVAERGFVADYRGMRISRTGRRFWIENGVIWQLVDEEGIQRGQAALFRSWRAADS